SPCRASRAFDPLPDGDHHDFLPWRLDRLKEFKNQATRRARLGPRRLCGDRESTGRGKGGKLRPGPATDASDASRFAVLGRIARENVSIYENTSQPSHVSQTWSSSTQAPASRRRAPPHSRITGRSSRERVASGYGL